MRQRFTKGNEKVTIPLTLSRQEKKDTPLNPLLIEGKVASPCGVISGQRDSWKTAHAELYAEIKIRHYSPKTLKTYSM